MVNNADGARQDRELFKLHKTPLWKSVRLAIAANFDLNSDENVSATLGR